MRIIKLIIVFLLMLIALSFIIVPPFVWNRTETKDDNVKETKYEFLTCSIVDSNFSIIYQASYPENESNVSDVNIIYSLPVKDNNPESRINEYINLINKLKALEDVEDIYDEDNDQHQLHFNNTVQSDEIKNYLGDKNKIKKYFEERGYGCQ